MALTRFPIETTDPRIQVTLPVGRHVLELVVEDSAGLRSAPDQVVIEVRKDTAVPAITGILPVSGVRGATVEAVISGTNLAGATAVTFSGSGVAASIGSGGTASSLPIKIVIADDAATGGRSFTVRTPSGTAGSPATVSFTVAAAEPRIIEPRVIEPRVIAQPISVEPTPITASPIVAEPRAIVAEPRLVTPDVTVRPVVETRLVTPDVVVRPVTPGKAAAGTRKTAPAKKAGTSARKKK